MKTLNFAFLAVCSFAKPETENTLKKIKQFAYVFVKGDKGDHSLRNELEDKILLRTHSFYCFSISPPLPRFSATDVFIFTGLAFSPSDEAFYDADIVNLACARTSLDRQFASRTAHFVAVAWFDKGSLFYFLFHFLLLVLIPLKTIFFVTLTPTA